MFWLKRKKQEQPPPQPPDNGLPVWVSLNGNGKVKEPNAMVVVAKTRTRILRDVPIDEIPKDSFEKKYRGKWLHTLRLDLENKLHPINRPSPVVGRTPIDLYMAKNCADEVLMTYGLSMPFNAKVGIGLAVGMGIAILIVIFLISAITASPPVR